jgi:hypothetical protein
VPVPKRGRDSQQFVSLNESLGFSIGYDQAGLKKIIGLHSIDIIPFDDLFGRGVVGEGA